MAHDTKNTEPEPDSLDTDDGEARELETPDGNHIDLICDTPAWPATAKDAAAEFCVSACDYIQDFFDLPTTSLSILLTDDENIRSLNQHFRGMDKPTNVLSFPAGEDELDEGDEAHVALGDIAIAYETVLRESKEGEIATHDHVAHLIVHGVMHLLGYDHETDDDADEMEALEIAILGHFGIANPYAGSDPIGQLVRQDHA